MFTLPVHNPFDLSGKFWDLGGKVLNVERWAEYEFFHAFPYGYLSFGYYMVDDESVRDCIINVRKYRHVPVFVPEGLGLWYHGNYYEFLLFQNDIYVIDWVNVNSSDGVGPTLHPVNGLADLPVRKLWSRLEKSLRMTEREKYV